MSTTLQKLCLPGHVTKTKKLIDLYNNNDVNYNEELINYYTSAKDRKTELKFKNI